MKLFRGTKPRPFAVSCVLINVDLNTMYVYSQCSDRTRTMITENRLFYGTDISNHFYNGTAVKNVAYNRYYFRLCVPRGSWGWVVHKKKSKFPAGGTITRESM